MILFLLTKQPYITIRQMSVQLHISQRKISRILKLLRETGIIIRVGSDRKGYWKINDKYKKQRYFLIKDISKI